MTILSRYIFISLVLFHSMSCSQDSARINLCKIGAIVGNDSANYELFHHYRANGKLEKAIECAIQAGKDGHIESQYELGVLFLDEKNYNQSFFWLNEASKQEAGMHKAAACHYLGIMYGFGLGVEKNREKSLEYFLASADSMSFEIEKFLESVEKLGFDMAMEHTWPEIKSHLEESGK